MKHAMSHNELVAALTFMGIMGIAIAAIFRYRTVNFVADTPFGNFRFNGSNINSLPTISEQPQLEQFENQIPPLDDK
jgi:hypothetical protein